MKCSLFLFIIGLVTSMAWGDSRPNIVFVFSDDHATQAISAYGGRLADVAPTPIWTGSQRKGCDSPVAW